MRFENVTLILPDRLLRQGCLRVSEGQIVEIGTAGQVVPAPGEQVVDGRGGYLAPGFVDLHVHGALRRDAMEASDEAFSIILDFHASGGTTALALTSVAASLPALVKLLDTARRWKTRATPSDGRPRLLGIHLEGPYFAALKVGAHRLEWIRMPLPEEVRQLLAYADVITQMTLAPELPGALDLISQLREHGIIASGGHSDAWDEDGSLAVERGMTQVTHVFNAMSSARRRGPYRVAGLLEYALSDPRIRCELIADGHHVSPTLMRMLYRAKGADGICLVTDAGPGTGLPEGSSCRLGDLDCVVRGGVGLTADGTALAASTTTMLDGVRNLVRLVGVPLEEAVQMATLNPAHALGVADKLGCLAAGRSADLVLLTAELEIVATYVGGQRVFAKKSSA